MRYASFAIISCLACATTEYEVPPPPPLVTPRWTDPAGAQKPATDPKKEEAVLELRAASSYANTKECVSAAERLRRRSPGDGWTQLRACTYLAGFRDLERLLAPQWVRSLRQDRARFQVLSLVMSRRPERLQADVIDARLAGFPLHTPAEVLEDPGRNKGALIVLLGQVVEVEGPEAEVLLVIQEEEVRKRKTKRGWVYPRHGRSYYRREQKYDSIEPTGRELVVPMAHRRLIGAGTHLFLAQFKGLDETEILLTRGNVRILETHWISDDTVQ